jgi:transcriptional regulator with XRE-family HTH domain
MLIATERQCELRAADLARDDAERLRELEEARKNKGFTQTYAKGWKRIRELAKGNAGAVGLYSFFAEHIDPSCGAVLADQQFLADQMCVSRSTISRWLSYLEGEHALVRIPVAGRVCAYALDPREVWKGYNTSKEYAAFVTRTLVNKDGDIQRRIMSMFSGQEITEHNITVADKFENENS